MCTSLVKGFVSLLGDDHDGFAVVGAPPLDPSTELRMSGPSAPGDGFTPRRTYSRFSAAGMIRLSRTGSPREEASPRFLLPRRACSAGPRDDRVKGIESTRLRGWG